MSGCAIGIKEKIRTVFVRTFKEPEETKYFIKVATNQKVAVTLMSDSKELIFTTMDIGGMVVNDEQQFAEIIREAKK